MGKSYPLMTLTAITMLSGLFVIIILSRKDIKGAVLLGIFSASVIYWTGEAVLFGINPFEALAGASFISLWVICSRLPFLSSIFRYS